MSEEVPFRSVKVTLSEEAIARLTQLRVTGSLRSDSATVEECIRALYDISMDLSAEIDRTARQSVTTESRVKAIPLELQAEALRRIVFRISRFIPATEPIKQLAKKDLSTGT